MSIMSDLSTGKKLHISKRSLTPSLHIFHENSPQFSDEKEDACTQTYANSTERSAPAQQLSCVNDVFDEMKETDVTDMSFYEVSPFCWSPTAERTRRQYYKDKTPKTVKMLKEKHRENERLRHHSLNQHLRLICRKVPGSAEHGKETKVVMMQRMISYIAYLENTVRFMCRKLGVKPNPTWLKITSSLNDMEKSETWRKEFLVGHSEDSRDSEVFSRNISHRLTLSSPTVDSTSDLSTHSSSAQFKRPQSKRKASQESQDSTVPTSSLGMDEDSSDGWQWIMSSEEVIIDGTENLESFLYSADSNTTILELPNPVLEGKVMESPDAAVWLASPDKSTSHLQEKSDCHYGIRCDSGYFHEQSGDMLHSFVVSPDQVMPKSVVKEKIVEDNEAVSEACSSSVDKGNIQLEQLSVKRAPLVNITNWHEVPSCLGDSKDWVYHQDDTDSSVTDSSFTQKSLPRVISLRAGSKPTLSNEFPSPSLAEHARQLAHSFPSTPWPDSSVTDSSFTQIDSSSRASAVTRTEMTSEMNHIISSRKVRAPESFKKRICSEEATKIDLRKSSWMNGFMMYSHIHRKQLIRERPGLHASAISKLLGHMWRGMTSEQQLSYREQARICSQELQKMLTKTC